MEYIFAILLENPFEIHQNLVHDGKGFRSAVFGSVHYCSSMIWLTEYYETFNRLKPCLDFVELLVNKPLLKLD